MSSKDTVIGDLVYQYTEDRSKFYIRHDTTLVDYCLNGRTQPTANTMPIPDDAVLFGVVVIPGVHNAYGDNSCGVLSMDVLPLNTVRNTLLSGKTIEDYYDIRLPLYDSSGAYSEVTYGNFPIGPYGSNTVLSSLTGTYSPNTQLYYPSSGRKLLSPFTSTASSIHPLFSQWKEKYNLGEVDGYSLAKFGNVLYTGTDLSGYTGLGRSAVLGLEWHLPSIGEMAYLMGTYSLSQAAWRLSPDYASTANLSQSFIMSNSWNSSTKLGVYNNSYGIYPLIISTFGSTTSGVQLLSRILTD